MSLLVESGVAPSHFSLEQKRFTEINQTEEKTDQVFQNTSFEEVAKELADLGFTAKEQTENFTLLLALLILQLNETKKEERHLETEHLWHNEAILEHQLDNREQNQAKKKDFTFNMAAAIIQIGTAPVNMLSSPTLFSSAQSTLGRAPLGPAKTAISSFMSAGPKAVTGTVQGVSSGTSQGAQVFGGQFSSSKQFEDSKLQMFIRILEQRLQEEKGASSEEKQEIKKMIELLKTALDALEQAKARV